MLKQNHDACDRFSKIKRVRKFYIFELKIPIYLNINSNRILQCKYYFTKSGSEMLFKDCLVFWRYYPAHHSSITQQSPRDVWNVYMSDTNAKGHAKQSLVLPEIHSFCIGFHFVGLLLHIGQYWCCKETLCLLLRKSDKCV